MLIELARTHQAVGASTVRLLQTPLMQGCGAGDSWKHPGELTNANGELEAEHLSSSPLSVPADVSALTIFCIN